MAELNIPPELDLTPDKEIKDSLLPDIKNDPLLRKVGQELFGLFKQSQQQDPDPITNSEDSNRLQINENRVQIKAVATEDASTLLEDLKDLGLQESASFGKVVDGSLPISAIGELGQLSSLNQARPSYKPVTNVGDVTSQADVAVNADDARSAFNVDGENVQIGVLSDSYNNLGGASDGIASGDLPSSGVTVLDELNQGGSDEGRAMIELMRDIAPKAEFIYHTAFEGPADFALGIQELINAGADIVVDDITYFTEPFHQDGIIAQSANAAAEAGVPYFSSAGNANRQSYESNFRASTKLDLFSNIDFNGAPEESLAHDFDPDPNNVDIFQGFSLNDGEDITLSLQWDQPHAQAGGTGSANDVDFWLFNADTGNLVANSTDSNLGGDPVEFLTFQNTTGSSANYELLITQFLPAGGPTPNEVKYIDFAGATSNAEFFTNSSTSFGHPNAAGAAGVGASFYEDTPEFGTNPPQLEPFSSAGGTEIKFDQEGNRLSTPEVREQPRFTAPDGTNTTFFGNDIPEDPDSFPNFFGTSAAAPHAAGVAALMQDAAGGPNSLSPEEIYTALENTAIDIGQSGFDFDSGNGLIQAEQAIKAVNTSDIIVRRGDTFLVDSNLDSSTDEQFSFGGTSTDQYLIGDLDDDGRDDLISRQGNEFAVDSDLNGSADNTYNFGTANEDQYLIGNLGGNSRDDLILRRGNKFFVDSDLDGGGADSVFSFGTDSEDQYLVADLSGDGRDDLILRRGNKFFVDSDLDGGGADSVFSFGTDSEDQYLIGDLGV